MEAYELVELIEKGWPGYPKETPFVDRRGKKTKIRLAFEHDGRWILISLCVGPRGGIFEEVIVLDPNQKIQAARLTVFDYTVWHGTSLLPLDEIRHRRDGGEGVAEVCEAVLKDWWDNKFKEDPTFFFGCILSYQGDHQISVRTVSGGLPGSGRSQGKRHR